MKVVKRNGETVDVRFDQIIDRLEFLANPGCWGGQLCTDPVFIAKEVCSLVYDGITTSDLDEFTAKTSASMFLKDPDYDILAGRIIINNHIKNTPRSFLETVEKLFKKELVSEELVSIATTRKKFIDSIIVPERDYSISYFGFKSLERSYLLKTDEVCERPQYLFMRVAIGISGDDIDSIKKVYDSLSLKYYTHATPTLFNAGTKYPQMSSCFLIGTEDSIEGIFKTMADVAQISKWAGGIGIHISNIRSNGSYISKTGGRSDGIIPMLKVYNDISRYINQSGKRNGSFAVYLEPWHSDVFDFLDAKKNTGAEEIRARDLFYALWVPDLFMKRVEADLEWSLMCPNECPGLTDVHSGEFEELYCKYEQQGNFRKKVRAKELWEKIINLQIETGAPYILYKDSVNRKSNQKNHGIIKSSNLCTEIFEYSDSKETAVCNLASLCLPMYVTGEGFNFELLGAKTRELVVNLNKVIDRNHYPTPESKYSNDLHRPIGIGIQGLADVFMILRYPFDSEEAMTLNENIFECIYFNSVSQSMELARIDGRYSTFNGSPMSNGLFQFDLWGKKPSFYSMIEWDNLRIQVKQIGLRNSLLVAPMPTASTAQIMGNNESFEPFTSNLYTRRVLAGEFVLVNKHLVRELKKVDLWTETIVEQLIVSKGSVQELDIPVELKILFRTAWELPQKAIVDMAIGRGPFICQGQSLNLFVNPPNPSVINSIHFYGWKNGLKTGSYYIRTKPQLSAQNFTIDPKKEEIIKKKIVCTDDVCTSCGA